MVLIDLDVMIKKTCFLLLIFNFTFSQNPCEIQDLDGFIYLNSFEGNNYYMKSFKRKIYSEKKVSTDKNLENYKSRKDKLNFLNNVF